MIQKHPGLIAAYSWMALTLSNAKEWQDFFVRLQRSSEGNPLQLGISRSANYQ